ncbi:MAG: diacylglycerol kinase [Clostridiales bacterium]|jgi:diacylglycerol kinase (ATP)|nr:diacylglycerol kinase [Clostridiales bacterium]
MKKTSLLDSFGYALQGVLYTLKNERNFRIHFFAAFLVLLLSVAVGADSREFLIILFAVILVLSAEMFNTAIETVVDMVTEGKDNPYAKVAKDVAAGAVFLAAVNAVIVGYVILIRKLVEFDITEALITPVREMPVYITPVCLLLAVMSTIVFKAFGKRTDKMAGSVFSAPSAHSAIAFCAATCILFLSESALVAATAYVLAFFLAQDRAGSRIDSILQVMLGAAIGLLTAVFVFQILRFI